MFSGCADFDDDDNYDVSIIYSTGEEAGYSGSQGGAENGKYIFTW